MNQQARTRTGSGRWALAAALTSLAIAVSSMASGGGQSADPVRPGPDEVRASGAVGAGSPDHRAHGSPVYSVINLPVEKDANSFLNEKGQVAFSSYLFNDAGFFDGERAYALGSLGGGYATVSGLNNLGVVIGHTNDASEPFPRYGPYIWTAARGMRALPGPGGSYALAINDMNQIVGDIPAPGITARAARWDPNARIRTLGPLPLSWSEARDINDLGITVGFADVAGGDLHPMLWDAAGRQIDLGSLGGSVGITYFVNKWGAAAGIGDTPGDAHVAAFYWSPRSGKVPTGAQDTGFRLVTALNDRGEISGNTLLPSRYAAYFWTRSRGMTLLPGLGPGDTDVLDLNNRGEMVGQILQSGGNRAVRWQGLRTPIDLTSRVHRAPAGLVISTASAINDAGVIAAHSNAGMILLRPGTRGTDAPVLGPIAGLADTVVVGDEARLSLNFVDNSATQTHKAKVTWTDGCDTSYPTVREARGVGSVDFQHRFCAPGLFTVTVQVTDSGGRSTVTRHPVWVLEPEMATLRGQGTVAATASGAGAKAGPLRFALWAPLSDQAAAMAGGRTRAGAGFVSLSGPFEFRAQEIKEASRSGELVRLEGTGRYNGLPGYRFVLEAVDGGEGKRASKDALRVRISHKNAEGKEVVDYDNGGAGGMRVSMVAAARNRSALVEGGLHLHE